MTKQPITENIRDVVRIGALAMLIVSGRVAYLLYAGHLWLTLAILALKICFTLGGFTVTFRRKFVTTPPQTVAPSALLGILFVCGSTLADLAVATLIR